MKPEDETNEVYRFFTEVGIINQLISTKLEAFLPGQNDRYPIWHIGPPGPAPRRGNATTAIERVSSTQDVDDTHALRVLKITL